MTGPDPIASAEFTSFDYVSSLFVALLFSVCIIFVFRRRLSKPWLNFGLILTLAWIACAWITRSEFIFDGKEIIYRRGIADTIIPRESIKNVGVVEGQGAVLPLPSPEIVIIAKPGNKIQGYIYSVDYFALVQAKRWVKAVTEYSPN